MSDYPCFCITHLYPSVNTKTILDDVSFSRVVLIEFCYWKINQGTGQPTDGPSKLDPLNRLETILVSTSQSVMRLPII